MRFEIALVTEQHKKLGLPVHTGVYDGIQPPETLAVRRAVRIATDEFIQHGLYVNDFVALAIKLGELQTANAGACLLTGVTPTVEDFIVAARELIEDARVLPDKALQMRPPEWEQLRIGVCMLEIVCHGICGVLGMPYKPIFEALHKAFTEGHPPAVLELTIRDILRKAGLPIADGTPSAANDPEAS